ncbi:helix-turn-helix domain-containing protein [Paenibacillus sp. strain BS8-2]
MIDEFYDLVEKSQKGDKEALQKIILLFRPAINSAKNKIKNDRKDDLEQIIIEKMIQKILIYDLDYLPEYTSIFRQLFKGSSWLGAKSISEKEYFDKDPE